ncbi:MAG: HIT family protein [Candidatus Nanoarchaeia archaeon]
MECVFCKIINGEIPGETVYEEEDVLAIMDINPANKGHVLVIPREHYETYLDLPGELAEKIGSATQKVASGVLKATGAQGFNILNNNKKIAGQLVPHVHMHIIPRFENDGVDMSLTHKEYKEGEITEYAEKIRNNL